MKDIEIFINSGWFTVPYERITYNEEGKKQVYPATPWKQLINIRNQQISPAGAVICKNLLVIDCDNEESTKAVLNLLQTTEADLEYNGHPDIGLAVKTKRGYHFYFQADKDIESCKGPSIDIQTGEKKLVFLPTTTSEHKTITHIETYTDEDKKLKIRLHKLPKALKEYIKTFKHSKEEQEATRKIRFTGGVALASIPQGSDLFYKRLTPKSFREDPHYNSIITSQGYLHPNDIKDGDGNTYLTAISGILTTDPTISIDQFWETLHFLNNQWMQPMSNNTLKAQYQGFPNNNYPNIPFNYDDDWQKALYSFIDIDGNEITIALDTITSKFIISNTTTNDIMFKSASDMQLYYANRRGSYYQTKDLVTKFPGVKTIFDPHTAFGLQENMTFNLFRQSPYLQILNDSQQQHSEEEIRRASLTPILQFFNHLFADQANHWLSFLKTKLTTFKYSAQSYCLFDSLGGAGKGALQTWLCHFVGQEFVTSVPYDTFKSKFNGPMEGKLFVFLNEFPDEPKERRINTDKIKDLTGSPTLLIEKKGIEPYPSSNLATYMITSNRVSIEIKDKDRRFNVIQCLRKFDDVFPGDFFETITSKEELTKLAIHLKYNVQPLSHVNYMNGQASEAKDMFLMSSGSDFDDVIQALVNEDFEKLIEWGEDILTPEHELVNHSLLAIRLKVHAITLSSALKPYITSKQAKCKKVVDRRKMFCDKVFTYWQYPTGTMRHLLKAPPTTTLIQGEKRI